MLYLRPVLRGILPPASGEIILYPPPASCVPPHPGFQYPIDLLPDLTILGDVSGTLGGHRLEYDEPLRISAVLPDSCEFCGYRLDKVAPNSPARRVIPPRGHERQGCPAGLSCLVILDTPTEVCSIVRVHPVHVYLSEPLVLLCGNASFHIPCGTLSVLRLVRILILRRCLCDHISCRSVFRVASGNGGAARRSTAAGPLRRATL